MQVPEPLVDRHIDAHIELLGDAEIRALPQGDQVVVLIDLARCISHVQRGNEELSRNAGIAVLDPQIVGIRDCGPPRTASIPEVPAVLRGFTGNALQRGRCPGVAAVRNARRG